LLHNRYVFNIFLCNHVIRMWTLFCPLLYSTSRVVFPPQVASHKGQIFDDVSLMLNIYQPTLRMLYSISCVCALLTCRPTLVYTLLPNACSYDVMFTLFGLVLFNECSKNALFNLRVYLILVIKARVIL